MKAEYIFIKRKDDFCNNKEQFLNMLKMNTRIKIEGDVFKLDSINVKYVLEHKHVAVAKEDLFHLIITSDVGEVEIDAKNLETVDTFLHRINDNINLFMINSIYDEVSIYYAKRLYPEIIRIENKLRKIIYLFMLRNVGSKWNQKNLPAEVKKSIENTLEKNKVENSVENYLCYADFVVLGWFFFDKYTLESNHQNLVEKLKLAENQTPEKLAELVERFESKSNWERYFSDKIDIEDMSKKWDELYGYRNQVAHTKKIIYEDYESAKQLISEMETAFDGCLDHMDEVVLTEEESAAVEQVAQKTVYASVVEPWQNTIAGGYSTLANSYLGDNYTARNYESIYISPMETMTGLHRYIPNYSLAATAIEPTTVLGIQQNRIGNITRYNDDKLLFSAGIKDTSILDSVKED